MAALDKSAGGAPAFNRDGALVGLVAPTAGEPKRLAGVALAGPHALIDGETLRTFLGEAQSSSDSSAPLSAGDIAEREKKAVVPVFCQR